MVRKTNSQKQIFWQKQVKDWQKSRLQISQFCRKHKLPQSLFSYWKRKFSDPITIQEGFVQVKPDIKSSAVIYEIALPEGMSVRVGSSFEPEVLKKIIITVREIVC